MVAIGGYTRLSGAGLSITTWQPITGIIPPLNEQAWHESLEAYKTTPHYQDNPVSLDAFKDIYWVEYTHRMMGRLIGAVFLLPLLWFAFQRYFSRQWLMFFFMLLALGGGQAYIGWFMVQSGLIDQPFVSPYRLALHLSMALILYGALLWASLRWWFYDGFHKSFYGDEKPPEYDIALSMHWHSYGAFLLLFATMFVGALVAGYKAGLLYPTYPLMDGRLLPPLEGTLPWYHAIILEPAAIQWTHRLLSLLTFITIMAWVARIETYDVKPAPLCWGARIVSMLLVIQFTLGIATLLLGVPTSLALAHQLTGILLFSALLITLTMMADYKRRFLEATLSIHGISSLAARSSVTR